MAAVRRSRHTSAILDASVAVKWVVSEEHSDAAERPLDSRIASSAPAHWLADTELVGAQVAVDLALPLGITIYDTLYLALAERQATMLITADRPLFEAARGDRDTSAWVRGIGDI
jgi:predicted nucleic acid-binding protein